MKILPLYPDPSAPILAGGLAPPTDFCGKLDIDPACTRCALSAKARNPCIPADGEPGGLLLVGERPGRDEDAARRPMVGITGSYLRALVTKFWKGPIVYDNATRCFAPEVNEKHIEACRPFLAKTIEEAKPTRIVALGAVAWRSLTGRSGAPFTQRRAYAWYGDVPIFLLIHNAAAKKNRFVADWFEADLAWALTKHPPFPSPVRLQYNDIETIDDADAAYECLIDEKWISVDAETSGRQYTPGFTVISVAVSAPSGRPAYVWGPEQLHNPEIVAPLKKLLADPFLGKVGANLKSDLSFLRKLGRIENVHGDVRLWRKLDDPEASGYLEDMAELVGMGGHKREMEAGIELALDRYRRRLDRGSQFGLFTKAIGDAAYEPPNLAERVAAGDDLKSISYGLVPRDLLVRYNARDAIATALLGTLLEPRLDARDGIRRVWTGIVKPMSQAISRMEEWGVPVNDRAIDNFDTYLTTKLVKVRQRLDQDYGKGFNPGSPKQVADLLFDKLKLKPVDSDDDNGRSTAEAVLESLPGDAPKNILEFRGLAKMKGTYCDAMREHRRPDGRIHPSILPDGARSGRTSCVDPNLQNIPRADDSTEGKMARDIFVASPGHLLVQVDYRQLEYRVAAMLSQDPEMIALIKSGVDFHTGTAQVIAPIMHWAAVNKPERSEAKQVNFALVYGMTDRSLALRIGCSEERAAQVRAAVLGKFRRFAEWSKQMIREVKLNGYCRTWWDGAPARWRSMWRIDDKDGKARSKAERGAINTPVQGTAADFCNASLSEVVNWIDQDCAPAELVLAIHDALLLNVKEDAVDEVARNVSKIMMQWPSAGVPIEVDIEVGPSWGSLKKYELAA